MNIQPNRFFHLSLVFLVALNLVPHFSLYTVPTLAVGGLCLVWRLLYEFQKVALPNMFTKMGFVVTLTYLVFENYGQILGLEAGSALLICAVSLKLIDHVGYRDAMILLFLNFMLLLSRFLESQTLGISLFAGFDLVITTALLVQLHNGSRIKFDFLTLLKTGSKLFLQITPFMVLLFFVFPRFSGNFLKASSGRQNQGGFKDSLEPGAVESLAQTEQTALRVHFYDQSVKMQERYWRGAILSESFGMKWQKGIDRGKNNHSIKVLRKNLIKHEVLIEPLFNDWLFALDRPVYIDQRNRALQKITVENKGSIFSLSKSHDKKFVYDAYSQATTVEAATGTDDETASFNNQLRVSLLDLDLKDQRLEDLIVKITKGAKNNEDIANKLMFFYQKQFHYTLSPGRLKTNSLSEFLFEKKRGFCEHFAASFASIMRLANVPTRVVLGFHGGRLNPLSDYYMISTKDAHAWTEIWSKEKKQWLRFDPTQVVAPLRLELGGEVYHTLSDSQRLSEVDKGTFLANFDNHWFKQSILAIDAVATNWNLFLLNYDSVGQKGFFARLGFNNINQNKLLLYSLLILLTYFLWVRLKNKTNTNLDSNSHLLYLKLRKKLEKKGFVKESHEGPQDFLKRCQKAFPDAQVEIQQFSDGYLKSEYGLQETKIKLNKILTKIKV